MCTSSTGVVVIKKQVISEYNLEAAKEEEALSSLIIQLDSAYMTYLIWLRVDTAMIKRVLMRDKAVSPAQRVWIRHQVAQASGASVSRLFMKIWRV